MKIDFLTGRKCNRCIALPTVRLCIRLARQKIVATGIEVEVKFLWAGVVVNEPPKGHCENRHYEE